MPASVSNLSTSMKLLLEWIADLSSGINEPVSIHMLLVQRAMHARGEAADLTASTKLSLELYERTAVYRELKELYTLGLIEFVGDDGQSYRPTEREIATAGAGEKVNFRAVRLIR